MKGLAKDMKAISKSLGALSRKTEKALRRLNAIEKTALSNKAKSKSKAKAGKMSTKLSLVNAAIDKFRNKDSSIDRAEIQDKREQINIFEGIIKDLRKRLSDQKDEYGIVVGKLVRSLEEGHLLSFELWRTSDIANKMFISIHIDLLVDYDILICFGFNRGSVSNKSLEFKRYFDGHIEAHQENEEYFDEVECFNDYHNCDIIGFEIEWGEEDEEITEHIEKLLVQFIKEWDDSISEYLEMRKNYDWALGPLKKLHIGEDSFYTFYDTYLDEAIEETFHCQEDFFDAQNPENIDYRLFWILLCRAVNDFSYSHIFFAEGASRDLTFHEMEFYRSGHLYYLDKFSCNDRAEGVPFSALKESPDICAEVAFGTDPKYVRSMFSKSEEMFGIGKDDLISQWKGCFDAAFENYDFSKDLFDLETVKDLKFRSTLSGEWDDYDALLVVRGVLYSFDPSSLNCTEAVEELFEIAESLFKPGGLT